MKFIIDTSPVNHTFGDLKNGDVFLYWEYKDEPILKTLRTPDHSNAILLKTGESAGLFADEDQVTPCRKSILYVREDSYED